MSAQISDVTVPRALLEHCLGVLREANLRAPTRGDAFDDDLALAISQVKNALSESHQTGKTEDGWIEWNGGECPVDRNATVYVRFRSSADTDEDDACRAGDLRWHHAKDDNQVAVAYDIIAYRLVTPSDRSGTDWRNKVVTWGELEDELRKSDMTFAGYLADHLARRKSP